MFQVLAVLVTGPLLAFLLLFAGCDGQTPALGTMCGHNIFGSLVVVTLAAWFVLTICLSLYNGLKGKE
jgi:hypothetical protein